MKDWKCTVNGWVAKPNIPKEAQNMRYIKGNTAKNKLAKIQNFCAYGQNFRNYKDHPKENESFWVVKIYKIIKFDHSFPIWKTLKISMKLNYLYDANYRTLSINFYMLKILTKLFPFGPYCYCMLLGTQTLCYTSIVSFITTCSLMSICTSWCIYNTFIFMGFSLLEFNVVLFLLFHQFGELLYIA